MKLQLTLKLMADHVDCAQLIVVVLFALLFFLFLLLLLLLFLSLLLLLFFLPKRQKRKNVYAINKIIWTMRAASTLSL